MMWLAFLAVTAAIVYGGTHLCRYGDIIAERTGMSRTWIGVLLVASATSLPELFTGVGSVVVHDLPNIAAGDVLGSCMFNLLILSALDLLPSSKPIWAAVDRGHALALGFAIVMLSLATVGLALGDVLPPLGWISPVTPLIVLIYLMAMRTIFRYERDKVVAGAAPGPAQEPGANLLYLKFGANAVLVIAGATLLPMIGKAIAVSTGLGTSFVGNTLMALSTSLPEVVTSVAAVRLGAVDMAFGNLLGSNIFNLAILGLDDLLYPVPLYTAVEPVHLIGALAAMAMSGVVIIGITYQTIERRRVVASDSLALMALYCGAMTLLLLLR